MQKILFLCIFVSNLSYAQDKTGYQWFLYNFNHIDFREMPPKVSLFSPLPFYETGSTGTITMCNKYGDFMFQTGGCFIANKNFDIMKNGDSINSTYTYHAWCKFMEGDGDFPLTQSSIALPYPKKDSFYLSFNLDFDYLYGSNLPSPMHLYYSTIDVRQDSGLGAVVAKRQIAIKDTLNRGYLIATKHSNNTDWWIIAPKLNSNCIFSIKVSSNGVELPVKSCTGDTSAKFDFGAQVAISPTGKKYARTYSKAGLSIYDFDNSTGKISNQKRLTIPNDQQDYFQGVVFSPNSRYLYVTLYSLIYQFNLEASDIQASRTVVGDVTAISKSIEKGELFECRLAPDGKIYISCPFNYRFLSVINRPNCPGKLCDFRPYSVELPFSSYDALPNIPYFEQPPANYNCDSIASGTIDISEQLYIYPNPANTNIIISNTYDFKTYEIVNVTGQILIAGNIKGLSDESIDISSLSTGIYFLRLTNEAKERVAGKKFSVIHR